MNTLDSVTAQNITTSFFKHKAINTAPNLSENKWLNANYHAKLANLKEMQISTGNG